MLTRLLLSIAEAPGPERRAVELAFDAAYVLALSSAMFSPI